MKIHLIIILFIFAGSLHGQKVVVTDSEERIDNMLRKGMAIFMDLDIDFVQNAWQKRLKEIGKYSKKNNNYFIDEANMPGISATPLKVVSKIEQSAKGVKVWYCIDKGTEYVSSDGDKKHYDEAVKILHDFGVQTYLADINNQLKDAEKVLLSSVKEQEKIIFKGQKIKENMVDNRQDSVKLVQKMNENSMAYKQLRSDSVANYQNQMAASENVEKMKKAVELVRAKIKTVE
ncbi:MAG: hypothetical protein NW207_10550 [Cytophagales bacterium]|nr:hypothetical protein [Cytophagales bacterium]